MHGQLVCAANIRSIQVMVYGVLRNTTLSFRRWLKNNIGGKLKQGNTIFRCNFSARGGMGGGHRKLSTLQGGWEGSGSTHPEACSVHVAAASTHHTPNEHGGLRYASTDCFSTYGRGLNLGAGHTSSVMSLPQVHLRKPCFDFAFP